LNRERRQNQRAEEFAVTKTLSSLSEAKNLRSLSRRFRANSQKMLKSLASCFAFRCSASLNMTGSTDFAVNEKIDNQRGHNQSRPRTWPLRATMIVIGSMIGSGIFIVSAESSRLSGGPGWLLPRMALRWLA